MTRTRTTIATVAQLAERERHSVAKGDLTVAMLTARFLSLGYAVLKPISELQRYDLVIDRGAGFERVQCKTGRLRLGCMRFNACSSTAHSGGSRTDYVGQIEAFGVYCPENNKCYFVPVDDVPRNDGWLRVIPAANGQVSGVRLAATYEM